MDATELRALQAPLRARYLADGDSARIPIAADADFRDARVTCTVEGWAGAVRAGLHPALGGDDGDACSGDMLLQALVACAGVTLRSVATAKGVRIRSAHVRADGVFDARAALGIDRDLPVGVSDVVVTIELDTDADDATLARLRDAVERYCVVARSLAAPPRLVVRRTPA